MKPLAVVNVVLALLVGLAAWRLVDGWRDFEENVSGASDTPVNEVGQTPTVPAFAEPVAPGGADPSAIALGNPFSVDRSAAVNLAAPPPAATSPRPYLFGTIRIGDDHMAMMAPSSATNRNEYRPFRVGQSVGGWNVVEIDDKSVVVASGGIRQTITINDPSARLPRVRPTVQPTPSNAGGQVSTVGAAPKAPPPTPTAQTPAQGPAPATRTIETPFGTKTLQVRP